MRVTVSRVRIPLSPPTTPTICLKTGYGLLTDRNSVGFLKRAMKRYGQPKVIVTDRLRSYRAAMDLIGNASDQEVRRWLNNPTEYSHQLFRQGEGAMSKFRDAKTLQKFGSTHASIHNHFNLYRHLNNRETFKQSRSAAQAEWCQLAG
jgi:putative transposase